MKKPLLRDALVDALSSPPSEDLLARAATLDAITAVIRKAAGCRADRALELAKLLYEDVHGVALPRAVPSAHAHHNGHYVMSIDGHLYLFNRADAVIVTGSSIRQWVDSAPLTVVLGALSALE